MTITDESFSIYQLVRQDPRYPAEAYHFVREAMAYAADLFELGTDCGSASDLSTEPQGADDSPLSDADLAAEDQHLSELQEYAADFDLDIDSPRHQVRRERHLTGQQLCEAIRLFALNQFGYMAKVVLNNWGITHTGCFGDLVYNMIDIGLMKKSGKDKRRHFDDVFDFDQEFKTKFDICQSINNR